MDFSYWNECAKNDGEVSADHWPDPDIGQRSEHAPQNPDSFLVFKENLMIFSRESLHVKA